MQPTIRVKIGGIDVWFIAFLLVSVWENDPEFRILEFIVSERQGSVFVSDGDGASCAGCPVIRAGNTGVRTPS